MKAFDVLKKTVRGVKIYVSYTKNNDSDKLHCDHQLNWLSDK